MTPDASLVTSDAKTKHVTKNPGVTPDASQSVTNVRCVTPDASQSVTKV